MRRQRWVPTTWIGLGLGLLLVLTAFLAPAPALAALAPQPCTEAGLDAALAAGGAQTFNCAPGSTITITGAKYVGQNVTLDGGGNLTIDGGGKRVFFTQNSRTSPVTFGIANLTITGGAANPSGALFATNGGAMYVTYGTVNVTNSTISGNSSTCGTCAGGGIYNQNGTVNITNSTISGNSSSSGGGIYNDNIMNITNSTITGNSAGSGAGLANNGTLKVTNSTIADNTFNCGEGGGIDNLTSGVLTVTNSTITGNASANTLCSSAGGGIASPYGTVTVTGSIVAGNSSRPQAPIGPDIDRLYGTFNDNGGNLLGGVGGLDPKLATLDFYGGTTQTRPPLSGSPAIDHGSATCAVTDPISGSTLSTDQRGASRPRGAKCDSGSAEYVPTAITSADHATFTAGRAGSFTVTATGFPTPALGVDPNSLPSGVTFTDNGDGTATLSGTPQGYTAGSYSLTFVAYTNADRISQSFTLTVAAAPTFYTDPTTAGTTFTVGAMGRFIVSTSGYPTPTVGETGPLPTGVTFTNNGNGDATLSGTPAAGTGGTYTLIVKASNGIAPDATQTITLTVNEAPAITSADHTSFTVGTAGSFSITTTTTARPTPVTITKTGTLPAGLTFTDNSNGTATLAGTPAAGSGGAYSLNLTASNEVNPNGTQTLTVNVNQAPAIATNPVDQTVNAGASVSFVAAASGFPTPTVRWQRSTDSGTTYGDIAGATNPTYTFTTAGTDNGSKYQAVFTNAAGTATSTAATLTVAAAPTIASADHATFATGTAGSFTVTTTAGYPTATTITTTGTLPTGVTFAYNGDGTATLAGTPVAGTGGTYPLTLTAGNGVLPDTTQSFTLTVTALPTITSADRATFRVGTAGSFAVTTSAGFPAATTLTATGSLPSGIAVTDNGDGTATLAGTPAVGTGGSYPLTFTATNAAGHTDQAFTLTVAAAPTITSADHATFAAGATGTFAVTTTPGTPATTTIAASGALPSGVTVRDNGDGTASLAGIPATGSGGTYAITLTASNGVLPDATQTFTLTVTEVPTITSAARATFVVSASGRFTVTTTAGYPTATTITNTGALPGGVTFTDNGDGTATLAGTPAAGTVGSYPLTITATNAAGDRQQSFTLTVQPANASPAITSADHATLALGAAGAFTVTTTAGYPSATTITETGAVPAGVTFADNGDGTATLVGTPAVAGTFPLTITASNGATADATQAFTLTVDEAPSITSADHATFAVGSARSVSVTARGFPVPTFGVSGTLPTAVTFTDHRDGTATLAGIPAAGASGTYALTLTADNGVAPAATQAFTLTVTAPSPNPSPSPARSVVTVSVQGGGAVSPAGATPYAVGTLATYSATPATGQLFLGWTLDGRDVGFASPLTFTVAADRTLVARFAARPAFADVAGGTPAWDAITQLAARGIIKGYGDGNYGPGAPIVRAQVAALIVRAFGWDKTRPGGAAPFSDLGGIDPELQRAIAILAQRGIIGGYGDGTFGPTDQVLHVQVISFVARAMVQAGYWTAVTQDDPARYPNVPLSSGHRLDLLTFAKYAGALPERPANQNWNDWATPASRSWTAQVLWQALGTYFGVDRVP